MKIVTVEEMIAIEAEADAAGVSYEQLMETAGKRTAEAIMERLDVEGKGIFVLVGPGNNGGDGLVAGRYLAEAGANVAFYLLQSRNPEEDANFAKIQQMGLMAIEFGFDHQLRVLRHRLPITDVVIDALLGTGNTRSIEGDLAKLLRQVRAGLSATEKKRGEEATQPLTSVYQSNNIAKPQGNDVTSRSRRPLVVAVDCPSGMNCNSGTLDPVTIPADLTVTYGMPKRGHFLFPAAEACGELVVADIGIAANLTEVRSVAVEVATSEMVRGLLPKRPLNGHKGTFGKVAIAAGSAQYRGAPLLAARGAFRAGSGLVSLWIPQTLRDLATGYLPEATYPRIEANERLDEQTAHALLEQIEQYKSILVGPGLGEATEFLLTLLEGIKRAEQHPPLILDADALNILAKQPDWPELLPSNSVLTPHPAEMARLMGISLAEIKMENRIELAQSCARKWGHIVLLKGAHTIIASPKKKAHILPFANPLLAVGGSGDVLSGVIASLLGQGVGRMDAAILGSYLHAATASLSNPPVGLLASDIADLIPQAVQSLISS
ncbi:MAG: NAD(P)H-hydrate dehydratase [Chloroflexota bacterium]